jgi:hypothetical protein
MRLSALSVNDRGTRAHGAQKRAFAHPTTVSGSGMFRSYALTSVIAGLDPAIHPLRKKNLYQPS